MGDRIDFRGLGRVPTKDPKDAIRARSDNARIRADELRDSEKDQGPDLKVISQIKHTADLIERHFLDGKIHASAASDLLLALKSINNAWGVSKVTSYYRSLIKWCWYGIFAALSISILIQLVAFVVSSFKYLIGLGG